ncbi:DM13 domain-containing protein [Altererythrobacter sp.]|nr:DM13 domain-containing protein [Altererythrobacter sp.]
MHKIFSKVFAPVLLATSASIATLSVAFVAFPGAAIAADVSSAGTFRNADQSYPASGQAEIVKLKGGGLGLKLKSNFKVRGGPDLRIWLSQSGNPTDARSAKQAKYVDLGRLKSSSGEQLYRIPGNVDLGKTRSVVIWCRAFGVFFGSASLK